MNFAIALVILPLLRLQAQSLPSEDQPTGNDRCWAEARKRYQTRDSTIAKIDKSTPSPRRLSYVEPVLPRSSEKGTMARTWLGVALVGPDGLVDDAWPLREPIVSPPNPGFDKVIVNAVKKWRYEPMTVDGEEIPRCLLVAVNIPGR